MKLSFLLCLLSLFLFVACGSDNDDDDSVTENPPTTNEDDRENEEDDNNAQVRYTALLFEANGFYDLTYEHKLRADLGRRPVIITGNFSQTPELPEDGEAKSCAFQVRLTEAQADRLETLANRVRYCSRDYEFEDEIVDFSELSTLTLTERNGRTIEAYKYDLGSNISMDQTWICRGRANLYSYVKSILSRKVPENCPDEALRKF